MGAGRGKSASWREQLATNALISFDKRPKDNGHELVLPLMLDLSDSLAALGASSVQRFSSAFTARPLTKTVSSFSLNICSRF